MWCPRDCGRGAVTHDPLHGGGTPVHGGVRHCHRHSHRGAPGPAVLSQPRGPGRGPAGGGPHSDHPRPGPAGHHHGHPPGGGQANSDPGAGPLLPPAHRAQRHPGAEPGVPRRQGGGQGDGDDPRLQPLPRGTTPGHAHAVHRPAHRRGQRHRHGGIRLLGGRRRPGQPHQYRHPPQRRGHDSLRHRSADGHGPAAGQPDGLLRAPHGPAGQQPPPRPARHSPPAAHSRRGGRPGGRPVPALPAAQGHLQHPCPLRRGVLRGSVGQPHGAAACGGPHGAGGQHTRPHDLDQQLQGAHRAGAEL